MFDEFSSLNFITVITGATIFPGIFMIIILAFFIPQCTKQKMPPTSRASRKVDISNATPSAAAVSGGGGGYGGYAGAAGQYRSSASKETTSIDDGIIGNGNGGGGKSNERINGSAKKYKSKEDTTGTPPKKAKKKNPGSNRIRNLQPKKDPAATAAGVDAKATLDQKQQPQSQPQQPSSNNNPDIIPDPDCASYATTALIPANIAAAQQQQNNKYKRYGACVDATQMGGIDDDNTESTDLRTPNWMKTPTYFRQKAEADKILDQKVH